jgi:hypothetical protein
MILYNSLLEIIETASELDSTSSRFCIVSLNKWKSLS